jgi:hypothetical protein
MTEARVGLLEMVNLGEENFDELNLPDATNKDDLESFLDKYESNLASRVAASLAELDEFWYEGFCTLAHKYLERVEKSHKDLLPRIAALGELANPKDYHYGLVGKEVSENAKRYGTLTAIALGALIAGFIGKEISDNLIAALSIAALGSIGGYVGIRNIFGQIDYYYHIKFQTEEVQKKNQFVNRVKDYIQSNQHS